MTDIERIQADCNKIATEHGFWEGCDVRDTSIVLSKLALIHSEISEAVEAARSGDMKLHYRDCDGKPEGFGVELADTIIRIFDLAEAMHIDLDYLIGLKMRFNATRPHKHGRLA